MTPQNRYWFLLNWQAWAVLIMGGGSLGRTGYVRLARAEQENRTLRAEQARLLGGLKEMQDKVAAQEAQLSKPSPGTDVVPPAAQ